MRLIGRWAVFDGNCRTAESSPVLIGPGRTNDFEIMGSETFSLHIRQYGWTVVLIEAGAYLPSFGYTIGLQETFGHPEIIAFGLSVKNLHGILNTAGELVREGEIIAAYKLYSEFFTAGKVVFLPVDRRNTADYFGYAIEYYGTHEIPALQLIWPDRNQRFPWEKDFEGEFVFRQPLLDRNAEFKFREAENTTVFTTRQWVEEDKPVLRVVHDEDGDWQFLTGDQLPEDARIVSLEQLLLKDPGLNDLFNLEYGCAAERVSKDAPWVRSSF
jgi:hypothetical protein